MISEVARFHPNTISGWLALHQEALARTSPARQNHVRKQLRWVNSMRQRQGKPMLNEDPGVVIRKSKYDLESIAKLPPGCDKDTSYVNYALDLDLSQCHATALSVLPKIQNIETRKSLEQMLHFRRAMLPLESGETISSRDAIISQINVPALKALVYARMAARMDDSSKHNADLDFIGEALKWARLVENSSEKAGTLLVILKIINNRRKEETAMVLRDIVSAINDLDQSNIDTIGVSYDVVPPCGGSKTKDIPKEFRYTESASLLNTVASLRSIDLDQIWPVVYEIRESATRICVIASIARSALQELSISSSEKVPKPKP